jgi:phospholipid/cholesterol/gamma-HCH transport system substrate-binding protein
VAAPEPLQMVNQMQGDLKRVINSVSQTSNDLDQVARKINDILTNNEAQIGSTIAQANRTMLSIEKTMNAANRLIDDPELAESLKQALRGFPALVQETRRTLGQVEHTFELASKSIQDLDEFTTTLRTQGKPMMERADHVIENLDNLTGQLNEFSQNLNSDRGTIGRLVRNPEIYERLDQTLCDADRMIRDARPIIDNAKVFSDKIARHPESLGVRGALERNPGLK